MSTKTTYQVRATGAPYASSEIGHIIEEYSTLAAANADCTERQWRGEECDVYVSGETVSRAYAGENC